MNRLMHSTRVALLGVALLGLALLQPARPGRAQGTGKDQVALKITGTGAVEGFLVPVLPPILSTKVTGMGEVTLQGQTIPVTGVAHAGVKLSVDGKPLSITDGVGLFTASNGDAIFVTFSGLVRPTNAAGEIPFESVYTVTGGSGRFVGATGSGAFSGTIKPTGALTGQYQSRLEGTISAPKA